MTSSQRMRFWLIALAAFLAVLWLLKPVLLPIVAGLILAYFLDPLADRLEARGLSRTLATAFIVGTFFLVVVLLLVILVPVLEQQILDFVHRVPAYVDSLAERIKPLVVEIKRRLSRGDIDRLRGSVGDYAGTAAGWALDVVRRVLSGGLAVFNVVSLLFITPVVAFYMIRDWDRMVAAVDGWLPREHAQTIRAQVAEIDRTISGFVRGQATVCLALAAYYGLGLSLIGLELGLVIGIGAGLVSFVPYLGALSGFALGLGLAIAQSPDWTLPALVAAVFGIGQVLEGSVLTPKLVGDRVGLHPVWIIFALLAGGALFGFAGLLLAVPVAAVVGVLARFGLARYLASRLYLGDEGP